MDAEIIKANAERELAFCRGTLNVHDPLSTAWLVFVQTVHAAADAYMQVADSYTIETEV